jgi:hypothetical protein
MGSTESKIYLWVLCGENTFSRFYFLICPDSVISKDFFIKNNSTSSLQIIDSLKSA